MTTKTLLAKQLASRVPSEMQDAPNWVVWKLVTRDGKETKVPMQITNAPASSTDPDTWATFAVVMEATSRFNGPGFVFPKYGDWIGIDWMAAVIPKLEHRKVGARHR